MKISALVKLYELGRISSGIAAQSLNMSRLEFLDELARFQVSYFGHQNPSELDSDVENA